MNPKVSIIIPTYNRAQYLRTAVESALAQDYDNLEIIVSNNASTDNTTDVITDYLHDKRIKYFRNDSNIGMYPNQRKALYEYATGGWAIMLDDDDYLIDNTYISKAMNLVASDNTVVIVHANFRTIHEKSVHYKNTNKKLPVIVDGKWMFIKYKYAVIGNINYDKLTVLFDRKKALELDFFNDTVNSVDRQSFLKLSLKGKIGFINDIVAVYRLHGNNASSSGNINGFFENLRAVTNPYEYAKKVNAFDERKLERWKRRMIRESAAIVLIGSLLRGDKKMIKELLLRLYQEYPFALTIMLDILKPKVLVGLTFRKLLRNSGSA